MAATATANRGRALALARRKAMSKGGKAAIKASSSSPVATAAAAPASVPAAAARPSTPSYSGGTVASSSARKASLERRRALSTQGKRAISGGDRTRTANDRVMQKEAQPNSSESRKSAGCGCGCGNSENGGGGETIKPAAPVRSRNHRAKRPVVAQSPAKVAALARRRALSSRGKAGISSTGMSEAQTARAVNPQLSGREIARAVREQRSKRGASGQKRSAPAGRRRKAADSKPGAAQDAPWKVGASETSHGQTVTGTMVGRDTAVTGDEASTCRAITGTEYLGADIFREFCKTEPVAAPQRSARTSTAHGNTVTGNRVGRSEKVTGDEPGTCKRVTGSEYVSAEQVETFCASKPEAGPQRVTTAETRKGKSVTGDNVNRAGKVTGNESGAQRELTGSQYTNTAQVEGPGAPVKVGHSKTLRGGSVSGTLVGRREHVTGDEAGSCRNITGDDYVGQEQYTSFCDEAPEPKDRKVGQSATAGGEGVTGSMTGRSQRVTGNEPGTCKAVTGTPYTGVEQYVTYCETEQTFAARKRMDPSKRNFGKPMTGQQPSVGGAMTGDSKGACEAVSGTPYVGADQVSEACPAAVEPVTPDFPQPLEGSWTEFSVQSPAHAAQQPAHASHVSGSRYEQGHITGSFGKAEDKVTGTEEARFGSGPREPQPVVQAATEVEGRVKSRVTGEGQDAGSKVTGDDWDRGERVTGTEGPWATLRNTTLRGTPVGAMGARARQPAEVAEPVSKVTGSSGNTGQGSLVTYSGGARG